MYSKAGLKSPSSAKYPITMGVIAAANPPIKLKTPPISPINLFGAKSETNTHVIEANPFPKKASERKKMISVVLLV